MDYSLASSLLILLLPISLYLLGLLSRKLSGLPPGPTPLPIIGNLYLISPQVHLSLANLAHTYGPIMSLRLGQLTTVVISSVDLAKEALLQNDQAFNGRFVPDAVRADNQHQMGVVWQPPNSKWRQLRAMYTKHIFGSHSLEASSGIRKRKVEELLAYLSEFSRAGRKVNVRKLVHATLNNIISNIEFSTDIVDLRSETVGTFQALARDLNDEAGRPNVSDFFPVLRTFDPQGNRRRVGRLMKRLYLIFDKLIEERIWSRKFTTDRKNDLLDALLDQQEEKKEDAPSNQQMKAQFVELFVAGTDTASSTLEWAMTELLRHPKVMERARSELREVVGQEEQVEEEDLANLPYLRAIVKETFRLHPPGPLLLPRQAQTDVRVGGFKIPKGSQVLVSIWVTSRDERIWTAPDRFMPERFVDSKVDFRGRDFDLIPFGAGRRICPGLPLADRLVHFMLASLVHSFDWKLPDKMKPEDVDMTDHYGIVLEKVVPLIAVPNQV